MDQAFETIAQSVTGHLIAYGQLLNQGKTQRLTVTLNDMPLTWGQAIELWQQNADFRSLITQTLRDSPYAAFFWETPPLTPTSLHQPWEFVLVNAPSLAKVSPNPQPFAPYLERGNDPIQVFANLGGDAILISPRVLGPLSTYTHLANFVRQGPSEQVDGMWQSLGNTLHKLITDELNPRSAPLWVSTSGLGVYWLHLRLDDFPKYYTHRPYRTP